MDWENGKNVFQSWKSQGILNRFEKSEEFTQNTGEDRIVKQNTSELRNKGEQKAKHNQP